MDEIFILYDKAKDPDYVGQDIVSREIIDKASKYFII